MTAKDDERGDVEVTMQWWLISDEDVQKIRGALEAAQNDEERACKRGTCWCDMDGGERCGVYYANVLHTLDSGLHTTDEVPADFAVPALPPSDARATRE